MSQSTESRWSPTDAFGNRSLLGDLLRAIRGNPVHPAPSHSEVRGIAIVVDNTRPDIVTADVLARLDRTLALIEKYVPHHFRHLKRDFAYIVVQRFACRGAYFHEQRACLVELTFTVNPDFSDAEVAATIRIWRRSALRRWIGRRSATGTTELQLNTRSGARDAQLPEMHRFKRRDVPSWRDGKGS